MRLYAIQKLIVTDKLYNIVATMQGNLTLIYVVVGFLLLAFVKNINNDNLFNVTLLDITICSKITIYGLEGKCMQLYFTGSPGFHTRRG